MRDVTNLMVRDFKIMEHRCDFLGYKVDRKESLTFHHLIIPHRNCKKERIPNDGYVKWNGAILIPESHQYLHLIEQYDYDAFLALTSEMIDENIKGEISLDNLLEIRYILEEFEREYNGIYTRKGNKIVDKGHKEMRLVLKPDNGNFKNF